MIPPTIKCIASALVALICTSGCTEKNSGTVIGSWSCESKDSEGNEGKATMTYVSDGSSSSITTLTVQTDLDRNGSAEKLEMNFSTKGNWKLIENDILEEGVTEVNLMSAFVNNSQVDTVAASEWFRPIEEHFLGTTQSSTVETLTNRRMVVRNSGMEITCSK